MSGEGHALELQIKHEVEAVTGNTKKHGVTLFRRLKSEWISLRIDYSMFNYTDSNSLLCNQANGMFAWAQEHLRFKFLKQTIMPDGFVKPFTLATNFIWISPNR